MTIECYDTTCKKHSSNYHNDGGPICDEDICIYEGKGEGKVNPIAGIIGACVGAVLVIGIIALLIGGLINGFVS